MTSRRLGASAVAVAAAILVGGCAGGTQPYASGAGARAPRAVRPAADSQLPGARLPGGWRALRLSSGALLPYPATWRPVGGDPGSASAERLAPDGTIVAYLNATPAVPAETTADWASFRLHHNAAEGDEAVRMISQQRSVRLGAGRAACVEDRYRTVRARYMERACLLVPSDHHPAVVLVAAAVPAAWPGERARLAFALEHFTT